MHLPFRPVQEGYFPLRAEERTPQAGQARFSVFQISFHKAPFHLVFICNGPELPEPKVRKRTSSLHSPSLLPVSAAYKRRAAEARERSSPVRLQHDLRAGNKQRITCGLLIDVCKKMGICLEGIQK
jgi:hypothetical protein